jgi:hypothetical protein
MAAIYDDIRAALEVHLSQVVGIPQIASENVSYTPTTGTPFVQPKLLPLSRRSAVRGLNPQQRYDGLFRVFCYVPEGNGPSAADNLANLVIDAFDAATDITNGGTRVSIDYAERESGFVDSPWYYVPVIIKYYIYA